MGQRSQTRTINAAGLSFSNKKTISYENATTVEKPLPAPLAGALTTRTSATAGMITCTTPPTGTNLLVVNDEIAIGWEDAAGVFQHAYMATVTAVAGNDVTFTGAKGAALPNATWAVRLDKMEKEPIGTLTPPTTRFSVGTPNSQGKLISVLGLAAELDIGTTTNAIPQFVDGPDDAKFLETLAEYAATNLTFAAADHVYVSNLSTIAIGAITAIACATRD